MSTVVYNTDCMDYMKTLPDNAFDLAVVDPPYGVGMGKGGRVGRHSPKTSNFNGVVRYVKTIATDYKSFAGKDASCPSQEYFDELFRVSKAQVIWGGNYMMTKIKQDSPCWIVWDKRNGGISFADCELAWTSFKTATRKFTFRWSGMLQEDMAHKEMRIHPTQKPVALYEWILTNYAHKGQRILDTHVGSGSSRIAAAELGFDYVGCELDNDYFDAEEARFTRCAAQGRLFEDGEKQGELIA